ncbi:AMP-binding protein [Lysinibacillus xylanilyticus]|uniref:AMP-binding protein n=1 Tax=Lysinibacillus xylanilyticus TaxID=582475 RepID=UPI0038086F54
MRLESLLMMNATNEEKQLYFIKEKITINNLYTETWCFELEDFIDLEILETAIQKTFISSPALRANFFIEKGSVKKVINSYNTPYTYHTGNKNDYLKFINELKEYSFDLKSQPLIQFHVWHNSHSKNNVLIINSHHIITDGLTKNLLLKKIMDSYFQREISSDDSENLQIPEKKLSTEKINKYANYIEGIKEVPFRFKEYKKVQEKYSGFTKMIDLNENLSIKIEAYCRKNRLSLFSFYLGCFYSFICSYSGNNQMRIGVPFTTRQGLEQQEAMGYYVNIIPFGLKENLHTVSDKLLDYFKLIQRQIFSISEFSNISSTDADISKRTGLNSSQQYTTVFSYQESEEIEGIKQENIISQLGAKFELTGNVKKVNNRVSIELEFSDEIWTLEEGNHFKECFELWLKKIAKEEYVDFADKSLISLNGKIVFGKERAKETDSNLYEKFSKVVQSNKLLIAIHDHDQHISYLELKDKVDLLANKLSNLNLSNCVVALQLSRKWESIALMLALAKLSIPFVHLSVYYPKERKKFILNDSCSNLIITDETVSFTDYTDIPIISMRDIENETNSKFLNVKERLKHILPKNSTFELIYTSGTTGNPKAVNISHRNILNFCSNFINFDFNKEDTFSQCNSYTFDASLFEIWLPLMNGASIRIIPEPITDVQNWSFIDSTSAPTISLLTTALLNSFVENKSIEKLNSLKKLFTGGESASSKYINKAIDYLKNTKIYNAYGPSENTTITTVYPFNDKAFDPIPLGNPIGGVLIGIIGQGGQLLPLNCEGEIIVAGDSLTEGYFNQTQQNKEKFITVEVNDQPRTFYKTGDIGSIGLNEQLYFTCRKDNQVKIRGFRVELTEIESTALKLDGVEKCIAHYEKDGISSVLKLFYKGSITEMKLRDYISNELPAYMVPNQIIKLDEINLTVNGKIDKNSIKSNFSKNITIIEEWNSLEVVIRDAIKENLAIDSIHKTDNFYELGIDSIMTMQICSSIQEKGIPITIADLTRHQTIEGLAQFLALKNQGEEISNEPSDWISNSLSPVQQWFFDTQKSDISHWNQSIVIEVDNDIPQERILEALKKIIDDYPIFKSTFNKSQDKWHQIINNEQNLYYIGVYKSKNSNETEKIISNQQKCLDITKNVYQFSFIKEHNKQIVHLVAHHLIIDGVSWRNILRNFSNILTCTSSEQTRSYEYKKFNQWIDFLGNYNVSKKAKEYWGKIETQKIRENRNNQHIKEQQIGFSKIETQKLKNIVQSQLFGDLEAALLAMTSEALFQINKEVKSYVIQMEGHGRPTTEAAFSSTIGWFTSIFPFTVNKNQDLVTNIISIHYNLKNIPNKGFDYQLVNSLDFSSDWTFNYMGEFDSKAYQNMEIKSLFRSDDFSIDSTAIYKLSLVPIIIDGCLNLRISYDAQHHSEAYVNTLLNNFTNIMQSLCHIHIPEFLPATSLQKGMLLQSLKNVDSGDYIVQWFTSVNELSLNRLQTAISKLIEDTRNLRCVFKLVDGNIIQEVKDKEYMINKCKIDLYDWSNIPHSSINKKLQEFLSNQRYISFDTLEGPLIRFSIIKNNTGYVFILEHHHLILDGWSMPHLFAKLSNYYENITVDDNISDDQFKHIERGISEKDYNCWEGVLSDYEPIEMLEINQQLNNSKRIVSERIDDINKIKKYIKAKKITLNQFFQLTWSIVLTNFYGQEDILFSSTVSGRNSLTSKDRDKIGMFISTLPFRVEISENRMKLDTLIELIKENSNRLQEYDFMSWFDIAEYFNESPEIQIGYVFENYPIKKGSGIFSMENFVGKEQVEFPLALSVTDNDEHIVYEIHLQNKYFNNDMIDSLKLLIKKTIEFLSEDVEDIATLKALLTQDKNLYPQGEDFEVSTNTFQEQLVNEFKEYSNNQYIITNKSKMTYSEVLDLVNTLIQRTELSETDIVAVITENRFKMTIYALACFVSGATYVPLSKDYNQERIQFILQDSGVNCMFSEDGKFNRFESKNHRTDTAYIIYTSGTTGRPKGVLVSKKNINNSVQSLVSEHILESKDILYQNISMTFDPSIMDILLPLYSGASIFIPEKRYYGSDMEKVLYEHAITVFSVTPSLLRVLDLTKVKSLTKIIVGGEQLRYTDISHVPKEVNVINMYGPTEVTIVSSLYKINKENRKKYSSYPIGKTIRNINANVYSRAKKLLPYGVPGELLLESPMVSKGYTSSESNMDKFTFTSNSSEAAGTYSTGDIVYINKDNEIMFIGRKDRQIKIRGFRIELNEIEQSISSIKELDNFQLIIDDHNTNLLLAYLGSITENNLRAKLADKLPNYMIPSIIKKMNKFPLLLNGKIDKTTLKHTLLTNFKVQNNDEYFGLDSSYQQIFDICKEVLKIEEVSMNDSFFKLGGNSLTAIQLIREINDKTDYKATIQHLFGSSTFEEFIISIEGGNKND